MGTSFVLSTYTTSSFWWKLYTRAVVWELWIFSYADLWPLCCFWAKAVGFGITPHSYLSPGQKPDQPKYSNNFCDDVWAFLTSVVGTFTLATISSCSFAWTEVGHLYFQVWTCYRAWVTCATQRSQPWRHSAYLEVQLSRTAFSFCANFSAVTALRSLLQEK